MTYETEKQASTGIYERWNPRTGTFSWAQYPRRATHIIGGTRGLNGKTWETRDLGLGTHLIGGNRDLKTGTRPEAFCIRGTRDS